MTILKYVLLLAVDPSTGFVVGLTKKKGPSFLLNKLTFPGGKREEGETVETAASREMLEETGLAIAKEDWVLFDTATYSGYVLSKLAVSTPKVLHARACEVEPVWHLSIEHHLRYAAQHPSQYAPDYVNTLRAAMAALSIEEPLPA